MKTFDKITALKTALDHIGVPQKQQAATLDGIDAGLQPYLPERLEDSGYGLIGSTGAGKSCAIAAQLKDFLVRNMPDALPDTNYFCEHCRDNGWIRRAEGMSPCPCRAERLIFKYLRGQAGYCWTTLPPKGKIVWLYWPGAFEELQRNAIKDWSNHKLASLPNWHSKVMAECDVLILDDLGRERRPNGTGASYAQAQLELVVDQRNANSKPIYWTSNLEAGALEDFYGAPFLGRILEDNPVSEWLSLPNRRIGRAGSDY